MGKDNFDKQKTLEMLGLTEVAQAYFVLPQTYVDLHHPIGSRNLMCDDETFRLYRATLKSKTPVDTNGAFTLSPYPHALRICLEFSDGFQVKQNLMGDTTDWKQLATERELSFVAIYAVSRNGFPLFKSIRLVEAAPLTMPLYKGIPGRVSALAIEKLLELAHTDRTNIERATELLMSDPMHRGILSKAGVKNPQVFLDTIHRPIKPFAAFKSLAIAREFCVAQIRSMATPSLLRTQSTVNLDKALTRRAKQQPETLTKGQSHCLNVIRRSFNNQTGGKVLLNGDVGTGKTLVFLLVAAAAADNGQQIGIMAPNELVAQQIYRQCTKRFPDIGASLRTGSERTGKADSNIVVGTQALLSLKDFKPDMLIVDEQHKFSVEQRSRLANLHTNILEASATPIPRSLAMALFDNWEQAILDECPVQKSINNHLTITNERGMVIRSINEKLQVGGKVVFVYPSVSASAKYSCINAYDRLDKHFDGKVGLIHSKVPADQKAATMQAFASGEKPLLVTSSIFEVGIDVPGITCMVVNQADRFGVAQLHQMRGRLVRSGGEADFFMVIEQSTKKHTLERLNAVRDNNNGFALSERDLEIRGFGELLGDAQSGSTDTLFKLANLQPLDFLQPNVITTALQKDEPR